jgi:hypothetical protein
MSDSTGFIIAAGAITLLNEAFFAPLAAGGNANWGAVNWRIIPATAIAAVALAGVDQLSPAYGKGVAVIALITVLFAQLGNAPAPLVNLEKVMGYGK